MKKAGKAGNPKGKSIGRVIALCFLLCAAVTLLCGCKLGAPEDAQVQEILAEKLPAAKELLSIFYGDGAVIDEASGIDESWTTPHYFRVAPDFQYQTIAELKSAAEKIFSEEYLKTIYEYAFEGTDDYMPRFAEDDGVLTVDVVKKPMGLVAEVYPETARVVSGNRYACRVEVECLSGTGRRFTKEVSLTAGAEGEWYLDSAVY